jgi:hypothetical protein
MGVNQSLSNPVIGVLAQRPLSSSEYQQLIVAWGVNLPMSNPVIGVLAKRPLSSSEYQPLIGAWG